MELKEIVKEKYGEAARRVAGGGSNGCCGGSALLEGGCDPITSNLYGEDEAGQIPEAALKAPSAAAIRPRWHSSILAKRYWIWVREAASTCCFRRAAWGRRVRRMASI